MVVWCKKGKDHTCSESRGLPRVDRIVILVNLMQSILQCKDVEHGS